MNDTIRKLYTRPSALIAWGLVLIFVVVGVLFKAGLVSLNTATIAMDLMVNIGLALSLAIIMSYAGYVSFGHAVFYGLGGFLTGYIVYNAVQTAYTANPQNFNLTFGRALGWWLEGAVLGALASAALAGTVGAAVLRLRGAFFAIATIGLDYAVLYLVKLYHNPLSGSADIPVTQLGAIEGFFYKTYVLVTVFFIVTVIVAYLARVSKFGYGLSAIREDEDAAEVLGVDTTRYKVYAFILSAVLTSLWGSITVWRQNSFGVDIMFSLRESVHMIAMNVIGGLGSFLGPTLGGMVYYALYRATLTKLANSQFIVVGIIVILFISLLPEGLVGLVKLVRPKLRKYID
ncbi:MAG: branched-chain amino acid ABC transporter permease [Desulfurococcales archaeon]|nr:branched-chain amino acid ABC transporter permease [Desulfurococcales archaeon]